MMGLSPQQIKQNREAVVEIIASTFQDPQKVKDDFLTYLGESDFWRAPASTQYHESYEGGLVEHTLKVYENLSLLNYIKVLGFDDEQVAKAALLHDLCKANFYKRALKSKRMDDGTWVRVETYEVNDQLPIGHGEKSVIIALQKHLTLDEHVTLAIRWHMGAYTAESKDYIGGQTLSNAMSRSKLVVALQMADMMSTYL